MTELTERIHLRAEPELIRAVTEWRRKQTKNRIPSQSEAIRLLLERALSCEGLYHAADDDAKSSGDF